jgi:P4 family phage/plasmid primase-like protien
MNAVLQNVLLTETPIHGLYDTLSTEVEIPAILNTKEGNAKKSKATSAAALPQSRSNMTTKNISEYLRQHLAKKEDQNEITNTRIGCKEKNIYGGSYHISDAEYPAFMEAIYKHVISTGAEEYLTEKQLESEGPILVDVDLRFPLDTSERQYSKEHIEDLIEAYLVELKKIYQFDEETRFSVFIFEKDTVNRVQEKGITKDGIHMIIGIKADHAVQQILRKKIVEKIGEIWTDLPITNSWSDVFDEGISIGHTNWQLYGCRKPNNLPYKLTMVYEIGYDTDDQETTMRLIPNYNVGANIQKLSVRYRDHPTFLFKSAFMDEYRAFKGQSGNGNQSRGSSPIRQRGGGAVAAVAGAPVAAAAPVNILAIRTKEELDTAVGNFLDGLSLTEYELREAYEYTMSLPESYYGDGSYNKWIRVGWALRNINDRLFIVWAAFSAQAPKFDFRTGIRELYEKWVTFDLGNPDGLTKRSIMHWSKHESRAAYDKIHGNSISYYIDQSIDKMTIESLHKTDGKGKSMGGCGDFDIATVLYHMFKEEYVCASVKGNIWYRFKNHRWKEIDSGTTLRKAISQEMRDLYFQKAIEISHKAVALGEEHPAYNKTKDRSAHVLSICEKLSKTNDKKNIMTEAKDLFYDATFLEKLDTNPYLLCFSNGVVDFKEKKFRPGYPWDNLSKCTNISYHALSSRDASVMAEIRDFMQKLFPVGELCEYMWDHLASALLGTSMNQTFNMYIGAGQNGKSVLVDLMTQVLGEYKGTVPTTLITQQRAKIGGLAPELVSMKGIRYAVMDEPRKGEVLNEGVMKQLTSGIEPIQCRAPYMPQMLSFVPQFKLVVCANVLFEIKSDDHGTWRRIRKVDFLSLFTESPVQGDEDKPYQYKIDHTITEKFGAWREVFAAMLVDRAYKTDGKVTDCPMVLSSSQAYRNSQDYIAEFIKDKVVADPAGCIKKMELNHEFTQWHQATIGRNVPSPREIHAYMDKKFGKYDKHNCWKGAKIRYETDVGDNLTDSSIGEEFEEMGDPDL